MKKQRKHYTPEEKVAILRRHLMEGVPISDLCYELGLQPTVFYRWQKDFFENGAAAFQQRGRTDITLRSIRRHPLEGYRRLTFMMLDRGGESGQVVAGSESGGTAAEGTGFEQPPQPHQHWHIDISYLNVCATLYYLCSILDGSKGNLLRYALGGTFPRDE